MLVEPPFDPEAFPAQAIQLGAEPVDFAFQLGPDQNPDDSRLSQVEELGGSPCLGFIKEDEARFVLDRQSDRLCLSFIQVLSQRLKERAVGGATQLDPSIPQSRLDFLGSVASGTVLDNLSPNGRRYRQPAEELLEKMELPNG
ncbi:MAG TPA: hypothetical protein VE685_08645 [Thermoanaerobaculia bacterium]|nr:hypothetical protein [Thermoanaerobaculia bacterium]